MSIFSGIFGQNNNKISKQIENLSISEKKQEAISFLLQTNRENHKALKIHKKLLSKTINNTLKASEFDYSLFSLSLELVTNNLFILDNQAEKKIIQHNQSFRSKLNQKPDYHNWIWNDDLYMDNRANSGIILDLLGYGNTPESIDELNSSLNYYINNRLKFFAYISLTKRSHNIKKEHILSIASDDETRGLLYNFLKENNSLNLFPKQYKNQEALSRADMVNWLIYPTELGRVPTKIELIKIITLKFDDVGPAEFYLWKFMANDETWKNDGWMVGLSGAFIKSETPTMDSHGFTFSAFTKLNEKTPDAHFEEIIGIMEDWNKQNNN